MGGGDVNDPPLTIYHAQSRSRITIVLCGRRRGLPLAAIAAAVAVPIVLRFLFLIVVVAPLSFGLESFKDLANIRRKFLAVAKMIKLHVTDGMVDSTNGARITHGTFDPLLTGKMTTMDTSKSDLVELDRLLPARSRLSQLCGRSRKDLDLLSDKDVDRV